MRNVAAAAAEAGSTADEGNIRECADSKPAVSHVVKEVDSEPSGVENRNVVASMNLFMAIGQG